MGVDWADAVLGGVVAIFVSTFGWLLGQTEKAKEIRYKADLSKLREEGVFVEKLSQDEINRELRAGQVRIENAVGGIDSKLDKLLLSGRLPPLKRTHDTEPG